MIKGHLTKITNLICIRGLISIFEMLFIFLLMYLGMNAPANTLLILSLIFIGAGCGKGLSEILLTKNSATDIQNQKYEDFFVNLFTSLFLGIIISTLSISFILTALYVYKNTVFSFYSISLVMIIVFMLITSLTVSEVYKSFERHLISGLNHFYIFNFLNVSVLLLSIFMGFNIHNSIYIFIPSAVTQFFFSLFCLRKLFIDHNINLTVSSLTYIKKINKELFFHSLIRPTSIIFIWIIILLSQINIPGQEALQFALVLKLMHFISFFVIISDSYFAPKFSKAYLMNKVSKLNAIFKQSLIMNQIMALIVIIFIYFISQVYKNSFLEINFNEFDIVIFILCAANILNLAFGPSGIYLLMTGCENYIQKTQIFLSISITMLFVNDLNSMKSYAISFFIFMVGTKLFYLLKILKMRKL